MTEQVNPTVVRRAPPRMEKAAAPPPPKKKRRVAKKQSEIHPAKMHKVAPFAVGSIMVIAVFIVAILMSYAQLVMVNDNLVSMRDNLSTLETEEAKLMAQYELSYDLQQIEQQMIASGQLTKIQPGQTYTLQLSEPDSVEYYQGSGLWDGLTTAVKTLFSAVVEYFKA